MSRASSRGSVMPSAPDGPITPSTPEPSPPEPSSLELPAAALVEVWLEVAAVETVLAAALLERLAPAGVAIRLPFKQGLDFGGAEISPDGLARVSCYLPVSAWTALRSSLEATVAAGEWLGAAPQLRSTPLPDTNWATAWHAYVHVQRFGRLVLRPTPCPYVPQPGEVVVDLEPGLAFGTGSHESTRLALIALERWLAPGGEVLDLGTGSGVLACAAARLGAAHVDAVDVDPLAVHAARRNARRNGLDESRVTVQQGDRPPARGYDFVVANITAGTIIGLADAVAGATRPGGICVAGGIIGEQEAAVAGALRRAGLEPDDTLSEGDWRAIRAVRPAVPPSG